MNLDDLPSGSAGSESNESPTSEAWLAERKRFLEDVRLQGSAARIPRCPPDITIEKVKQGWPAFWKCLREALRVARQKDCPPGLDLEDGLMAMRELEKMVREGFRWLKRVERSPAKTAYDKKRAPQRVVRDKERTGRSGRLILRHGAETTAEFEKRLEAQRQSRANYDEQRCGRPSGHRINARPVGGHFVIVDSEGVILNEKSLPATRTRGKKPAYSSGPAYGWLEALKAMKIKSWRTKAAFRPREFLSGSYRYRESLSLQTVRHQRL